MNSSESGPKYNSGRYVLISAALVTALLVAGVSAAQTAGGRLGTKSIEEPEPDPDPTAGSTPPCPDDGEGELSPCPAPVSPRELSAGSMAGTWEDVDVFSFVLASPGTVTVEGRGPGAIGALHDASGRLLAVDGGGGGGFRLVRTLGPGPYTVRISATVGTGDKHGDYGLRIDASEQ